MIKLEPSVGLLRKIVNRIEREEKIAILRKRILMLGGGMAAFLAVFGYFFEATARAAVESGFADYFSLIFSNPSVIFSYWQNLWGTLLESFPVMEVAVLLLATFAILQLLRYMTKEMKIISNLQLSNN